MQENTEDWPWEVLVLPCMSNLNLLPCILETPFVVKQALPVAAAGKASMHT